MSLAKGAEYPAIKSTHANITKQITDHQMKQKLLRLEIQGRVEALAADVVNEYLHRKPHRATKGELAKFPTNELTRALKAN